MVSVRILNFLLLIPIIDAMLNNSWSWADTYNNYVGRNTKVQSVIDDDSRSNLHGYFCLTADKKLKIRMKDVGESKTTVTAAVSTGTDWAVLNPTVLPTSSQHTISDRYGKHVLPLLKPGVGQNIAMHALPTARNFLLLLISTFPVHSPSIFFRSSPYFLAALVLANTVCCVVPWKK